MTKVGLGAFNKIPSDPEEAPPRVLTYEQLGEAYREDRAGTDWDPVCLGWGTIDRQIRGVSPGQVLGIAARTSVGKTWMLQTIEHNFSYRRNAGCLSLTLEMPGPEWYERAVAIHADLSPNVVEEQARASVLDTVEFYKRMKHTRVCEHSIALDEVRSVMLESRASLGEVPLRLVLIDYLGLLRVRGDAYERASQIGLGLKQIAKAEKVAVIVAMQISRAGGDGSSEVGLEMLRDSGVLEESVDFLLGAWQPGRANGLSEEESEELQNVLCVKVLKSRKGGDGHQADLRFHPVSRRLYEEVS